MIKNINELESYIEEKLMEYYYQYATKIAIERQYFIYNLILDFLKQRNVNAEEIILNKKQLIKISVILQQAIDEILF